MQQNNSLLKISFPYVSQEHLDYAVHCLETCMQEDAKDFGFNYPYFTPGGMYGKQWWQLDSSLALCGYKWIDRQFANLSIKNFIESQKEDGRICLWGNDVLPGKEYGEDFPDQTEGASSLPKLFDVAYHVVKGCDDKEFKTATFNMMKKYLDWWFSARQDKKTGLITALFEETFVPYLGYAGEYAGVDTNVEVCVGCYYTAKLANELGFFDVEKQLLEKLSALKESINKYLWNEQKGAYYPYSTKEEKQVDFLMASTFYPLRLQIAPKDRQEKLLKLLQDHEHFNWNSFALTSVSKRDPRFVVTEGRYQGSASWSGSVWTLINQMVILGLSDCGENALATELSIKTLKAFGNNCTEFVNPFTGAGNGVVKYAWSASQYIQIIIDHVFGVQFDASKNLLTIKPMLFCGLDKEKIAITGLNIKKDVYLDLVIDHGKVSYSLNDESIQVNVL